MNLSNPFLNPFTLLASTTSRDKAFHTVTVRCGCWGSRQEENCLAAHLNLLPACFRERPPLLAVRAAEKSHSLGTPHRSGLYWVPFSQHFSFTSTGKSVSHCLRPIYYLSQQSFRMFDPFLCNFLFSLNHPRDPELLYIPSYTNEMIYYNIMKCY